MQPLHKAVRVGVFDRFVYDIRQKHISIAKKFPRQMVDILKLCPPFLNAAQTHRAAHSNGCLFSFSSTYSRPMSHGKAAACMMVLSPSSSTSEEKWRYRPGPISNCQSLYVSQQNFSVVFYEENQIIVSSLQPGPSDGGNLSTDCFCTYQLSTSSSS